MKKICVTGANGFIGKSICESLGSYGRPVRGFVRKFEPSLKSSKIEYVPVGDINSNINWEDHFFGYDCIIHCAGRAHVMNKDDQSDLYQIANVESTRRIAHHAAKAGVKRLIFLSSIKVNGEGKLNDENKIITINDLPNPQGAYAISKFDAENILLQISAETKLEVVIIRLPLVYGKGVKGNLAKLIKLIEIGIPLPLGLVKNKRSLIGIDNLIDLLLVCTNHTNAAGKTFLVSDDQDLSTYDLINYIASSMGNTARLFPVPNSFLKFFSRMIGRQNEVNRLLSSLQVDISHTKEILNWKPIKSVEEGIKNMVKGL